MSHQSPQFSVCIPNFNYRKYLELTYLSVKAQNCSDYEVVMADNQSTDGSIEFMKQVAATDAKVRFVVNPVNLGFAGNLEKVTTMAAGRHFILLSSDDLINAGALTAYQKLLQLVDSNQCVVGSSVHRIDSEGTITTTSRPNESFWKDSDIDAELSRKIECTVYAVRANDMLARCLAAMGSPYYFLTVCYPAALFQKVGGYGGGRMYNPDKWFNWKLFSEARMVYLIDKPLFSYRWHQQNQVALETSFGHLRYLVDEYRNTIELTDKMLSVAAMTRANAEKNFIYRDIYKHGIGEFSKSRWLKSMRIFFFGLSVFPARMIRSPFFLVYLAALLSTPVGSWISSLFAKRT